MAAQQMVTDTMREHAALWLARAKTWTRATRKSDGLAFVIFPSSRTDTAYYANESGCTCRGFLHRGVCSHVLAVRLEAEQARESVGPRSALSRMNDLLDRQLVDAF